MFNDYIYSDGDKIFVKAYTDGDRVVSEDGQVFFEGDSVGMTIDGQTVRFALSEVKNLVALTEQNDYILFDLDKIFRKAEKSDDGKVIMSDSVVQFLLETSDYYDKQDYLELIFKYDYFNYRDIDEFIRKVGE